MTLTLSLCPGCGSEALVAYRGHPAQGEGESKVWCFPPETVVGSLFFVRAKFPDVCSIRAIGKIYRVFQGANSTLLLYIADSTVGMRQPSVLNVR